MPYLMNGYIGGASPFSADSAYRDVPGLGVSANAYTGMSLIKKFGDCTELDIAQGEADIWDGGTNTKSATGVYPWSAAATVLHITGAAADNGVASGTGARTIEIQGLDANYEILTETVTTNGATNVITSSSFLRVFRMVVKTAGSGGKNAGEILAKNPSAVLLAQISTGNNQTLMALYTVPAGKTGYIESHRFALGKNGGPKTAIVSVSLYWRPFGEVFQLKDRAALLGTASSSYIVPHRSPHKVTEKTDIIMRAETDTDNTEVSAAFDLILVND